MRTLSNSLLYRLNNCGVRMTDNIRAIASMKVDVSIVV
jgi:hypothetical protein